MLNVDIIIIIIGKRRVRIYLNNKKWMDKASQKLTLPEMIIFVIEIIWRWDPPLLTLTQSPDQIYAFITGKIRGILRRIQLILGLLRICCGPSVVCCLAITREVSGVVYVPGNMAASFRGRPIRSLRMRGKHKNLGSAAAVKAGYCKIWFCHARDDLGVMSRRVRGVCFWQVGMTAGRRTYRWIWAEVSRGFITSPWKRLLFKMDEGDFCKR